MDEVLANIEKILLSLDETNSSPGEVAQLANAYTAMYTQNYHLKLDAQMRESQKSAKPYMPLEKGQVQ